jgi:polar amino acid transport system substrate-binding protein
MRRLLCALALICAGSAFAAADSVAPPAVVKALAPTGKLRAAINLVNTVIAQRDPETGQPKGISVELARELARRLGVPVEFVIFQGAGAEFDAAQTGVWDIGFFAIGPARRAQVHFTGPYVELEGAYMVQNDSPVRTVSDVDRPGTRVAVGKDSVYDHYLTRTLKNAELVRVSPAALENVVERFLQDDLEVAAFIRIPLATYAKNHRNVRMVPGNFMKIQQAIAMPRGRGAAARTYLHAFVEDVKASGFVEQAVLGSGDAEVKVAPADDDHSPGSNPPGMTCEALPPTFRSDASRVVKEKIAPNSPNPTGNTYFLMRKPYKYVVVHLNPATSDTAPYLVKLISRYTDDTIYEPIVETIYPKANVPYRWGPIAVMARKVPRGKVADAFNVKVQENYAMDPKATGFSYSVWVDGCN